MSRRSRKHHRRRAARDEQQIGELVESLKGEIGKPGMSLDEAVELIAEAARIMLQRMTTEGAATMAPWGRVCCDQKALEKTLQTSILLLCQGSSGIDERGDAPDLTDEESAQLMFKVVSGAASAGAAAVLWLTSQPLTYDLARHLRATPNPVE